jgi:predicted nucleic acid-binding protein
MDHFSIIHTHYLDASAAVKLVADEPGSENVRTFFSNESGFYMTQMCIAETYGALKLKFVKGHVTPEQYLRMCLLFTLHLQGKIKTDTSILFDTTIYYGAEAFARKHKLDLSDAMQLFTLKEGPLRILAGESKPMLITADGGLAEAAVSENLRVWNCLQTATPVA